MNDQLLTPSTQSIGRDLNAVEVHLRGVFSVMNMRQPSQQLLLRLSLL